MFVLVVGTTHTARIEGISAAGSSREAMVGTPAADAELVRFGRTVRAPSVPVSPSGCPTPALVTRAVRELLGFELVVIDAGLAVQTGAPTIRVAAAPGGDVRDPEPVPAASAVTEAARALGGVLPADELVVGESLPGGTTTALGVLRALGEPFRVSSSLPENPVALKDDVVAKGLAASGLEMGDAASAPDRAVRLMGDPVLATVMGLVDGAAAAGKSVTLAGGTQMVAAGALVRHAGIDEPLDLATTSYVAEDGTADVRSAADRLGLELAATDPGFDRSDHPGLARYSHGEGKEGVGMGGALALAARAGIAMSEIRARAVERYEATVGTDGGRAP